MLFLSRAELQELTGFKYASKQIEWLRAEAFVFRVGADGYARVLKAAVYDLFGAQTTENERNSGQIHWEEM